MLKIKKLDLYILRNFILSLSATFFICLFVLLMQFLWRYIDELVGKGLEIHVLLEFFFYSSMTLVPLALPLSVLLASLITFGNFGERLELLAMKAAGVSLFRIIRPLVIFVFLLSIGMYFFSNDVIPRSQVKLWTLIYSMKQKTPEIDIPEGSFYSEIPGYNIYVREKDMNRNLLKNIMIYDISHGFENMTVTAADSARIQFTEDKKYLVLTLYSGESFENLKMQNELATSQNFPYRRESFDEKQIVIEFDSGFSKASENVAKDKYVAKNIAELHYAIDTIGRQKDSVQNIFAQRMVSMQNTKIADAQRNQSRVQNERQPVALSDSSLFSQLSENDKQFALRMALGEVSHIKNEMEFRMVEVSDLDYYIRRHQIEIHRKYTLPFACLIFFFIGAPLGAIIRKGGLGLPVVISVALFIVYYMIDNSGYKFARDGMWTPLEGMWLSSVVLLPLGIFLTYKAATDSVLFNVDSYFSVFKNFKQFIKRKNNDRRTEEQDRGGDRGL
ncbi:MAG: LptF/LptG family permease [Paludibacteraceae bacterium]|nr:LptF/LptG family permease [Paludibacteraceae bacterium]MBR6310278.1 LptF/LptG family permease [Paludibacteraceae bacterium]